ncbi:MAG: AAA family ATPase [Spirochaetes bacterium]|nr:AAA family ATPase [Spirochaetota bacterium]
MKNDINHLFEKANNYFFKNDYDNAVDILKKIVQKNPRHFPSYEKLAQIEAARGNPKDSINYYKKYLRFNSDNSDVLNDMGNIYFDMKDYKNSIKCYQKTIKLEPDAYWAYYNIGLATLELDNSSDKAIEHAKNWFKKAIRINPEYYPALNELGLYFLRKVDYKRAKEYFNRSIKSNTQYKYPYFNLSKLYKETKQNDKAKLYLIKAIRADANYIPALNNLGIIHYEEENYYAALYYYTMSLKSNKNYKYAYYNMGLIFDALGKYRKALTAYTKALEIDPHYDLAAKEKNRLETNYKDLLDGQEDLVDADFDPEIYKSYVNEKEIKDSLLEDPGGSKKRGELFSEKFGRNITRQARDGKLFEIVGRDKEISNVLEILFSIKKNNPLLIGKSGVGKTAIIEGIGLRIASGDVPDFFKDKEIIEINMGALVAGTTFRGDFEKRLKNVIEEIKNNDNIILFIDEVHTVLGAGETTSGTMNAANILKPALARGELRCIGATTTEEYQKFVQKDAALDRRFQKIQIDELNRDAALDILKKLKPKMEEHYQIKIDDKLLSLIIDLSEEEIKNRVFPDKCIDIMEKVFSRSVLNSKKKVEKKIIQDVISEMIGTQVHTNEQEKNRYLVEMDKYLNEKVLGQEDAIARITRVIKMTKTKLDLKPEQPDGVILFAGSSGVGKTYLAKEVALYLYKSLDKLITLNMSEFTEPHSVSKLLGAPPGYVGFENSSVISTKILENPSCIVLLDEIEKAHPEVLKVFLQIFDEGKITDTSGRDIYFSNATIIMTSNAEMSSIGFANEKKTDSASLKSFANIFPQEFLNRIDEIVIFNKITRDVARQIIEKQLVPKAQKIFTRRNIDINFEPGFTEYILENGYSQIQGVRNLERVFEKEVMNAISHQLFSNPDLGKVTIVENNGEIVAK